jgi:choline dehydrogenase-like flavoprotein
MKFIDLNELEDGQLIQADLCIVGTGPSGMTIARQLARTNLNILMLESGGREPEPETQALYEIEATAPRRISQDVIRARVTGGSSRIWTGRCAPFHPGDFEERPWVSNSGWPISRADYEPWLAPAGELLGLGPNCYDNDALWPRFGVSEPAPSLDRDAFEPMFWQFSKSPRNPKVSVDFGKDRLDPGASNIRILLHANLTHINTGSWATRFDCAEVRSLSGKRACVRAKALVLCCGGVENARLLLASNRSDPRGVGNQHDTVGRFLMDHSDSVVGSFDPAEAPAVRSRFGHYWIDDDHGRHVYLHGLALNRQLQEREQLLNCHAYLDCFDPAERDPWSAIDRAKAKLKSGEALTNVYKDAYTVISHSGELLRGLYRRRFQHRPQLDRLSRVELHLILEQVPDPESRVTLSENKKDALGMPISNIVWKISELERRTAARMTQLLCREFERLGLPAPKLNPCLDRQDAWVASCVEKAHPTGTTRMSDDPKRGVVDRNCQVHGINGLFISGSSVFPTPGAANPTLMVVATALRLAETLKSRYAS